MSSWLLWLTAAWSIAVMAHRWRRRSSKPPRAPARHGGLALASLMLAGAHGVATMMAPALMPLCVGAASTRGVAGVESWWPLLAAAGVHGATMFGVAAAIAGLACRRRKPAA